MAARKKAPKKKKPKTLHWEQESGWNILSAREKKQVLSFCDDYRGFLSDVKTEREANDRGVVMAKAAGFKDLLGYIETGKRLKAGDRVYRSIAGKTLVLAVIGTRPIEEGMRIIGGHTDSPRLDLKPRPLYEDGGMALFDSHYYGGVKKYQWVAMPLALHGVVVRKDGTTASISIGEDADDPVFTITDLLPHLGKDQAAKKLSEAITGEGLNILVGSIPVADKKSKDPIKRQILNLLYDRYDITEQDFVSAELELVPAGPARDLGFDRSMILGYGHDDRVSAYTAIRALLDLKGKPKTTAMCILCDKEEIGSYGATGMEGKLFENLSAEIVNLLVDDYSDLTVRRCLRRSKMLSADVNALHDPNFPEVSSPNANMAKLNYGVVVTKYTGSRGKSGASEAGAEFVAEVRQIFDDAKVLWQTGELGKVDQGGGGTISWMMARYEMDVLDCGIGVLSMHAPWEVAGKLDIHMAYRGYKAFYSA